MCCLNSYDDLDDAIWRDKVKQPSARVYHESVEGGLHVVSADTDYGRLTWWIDPLRGWSPVRATYERDGRVVWESRSTLKQYGDVWYPEKVVFLGGSGTVMEVVEVQRAAFNQPDQPSRLTPAAFGAEVGMLVDRHTSRDSPMDNLVWDGEKPIETLEFAERLAAGELKYGPRIAREVARIMALENASIGGARADAGARATDAQAGRRGAAPAGSSGTGAAGAEGGAAPTTGPAPAASADLTYETRWQRYVREFIARHLLDDEQQQKAHLILQQCEARAGVYLTRRKADFEALEQRMASVETLAGDERAAAERDILAQRDSLFTPINDIFEKQLKPRLDRLLTRAQRAKAKSSGEETTGEP